MSFAHEETTYYFSIISFIKYSPDFLTTMLLMLSHEWKIDGAGLTFMGYELQMQNTIGFGWLTFIISHIDIFGRKQVFRLAFVILFSWSLIYRNDQACGSTKKSLVSFIPLLIITEDNTCYAILFQVFTNYSILILRLCFLYLIRRTLSLNLFPGVYKKEITYGTLRCSI